VLGAVLARDDPTGGARLNARIPMCLAVPGKILSVEEIFGNRVAKVQFGGITREAVLDLVPEAAAGDYVMVHAGFAITRVDEEEAQRTYELLAELGAAQEGP
jgi:hydrogenase expression/formation protein HypC